MNIRRTRKPVSSFDVFDTCLARSCSPREVFTIVERRLGIEGFAKLRLKADKLAHRRRTESTISDIYAMAKELNPGLDADKALRAELEVEEEALYPIESIRVRLENERKQGREIWFVSDMYLPSSFIRDRLLAFNLALESDPIVISCEFERSKRKGTLFPYLRERYWPCDIRHFGDNPHADIVVARRADTEATLLDWSPPTAIEHSLPQECSVIMRRRRLSLPTEDPQVAAGLQTTGLVAAAFLDWVRARSLNTSVDALLFGAREGQMLRQLYSRSDQVAEQRDVYFMLSRHSLFNCYCLPEHAEFQGWILDGPTRTARSALKNCNWKPERWKLQLEACGLAHFDRKYPMTMLSRRISTFFAIPEVRLALEEQQREQRKGFLAYWRRLKLPERGIVMLIDVGWSGTIQNALQKVCSMIGLEVTISGSYLALFKTVPNAESFITENTADLDALRMVIEQMFPSSHGQTIGYSINGKPMVAPHAHISRDTFRRILAGAQATPLSIKLSPTQLSTVLVQALKFPDTRLATALGERRFNAGIIPGYFLIPLESMTSLTRGLPWIEGYLQVHYGNGSRSRIAMARCVFRAYRVVLRTWELAKRYIRNSGRAMSARSLEKSNSSHPAPALDPSNSTSGTPT